MSESVKIEGLAKLSRELKKVSTDLPKEMKQVGKDAAELVANTARQIVPKRTGKLQGAIKAGSTTKGAYVKAAKLIYAKPIHFGWAKHHIKPQPFIYDALDKRRDEVIQAYEKGLNDLIEKNFTRGTGE